MIYFISSCDFSPFFAFGVPFAGHPGNLSARDQVCCPLAPLCLRPPLRPVLLSRGRPFAGVFLRGRITGGAGSTSSSSVTRSTGIG
jgi:hypothetical protein